MRKILGICQEHGKDKTFAALDFLESLLCEVIEVKNYYYCNRTIKS